MKISIKQLMSYCMPLLVFFTVSAIGFAPQFSGEVLPQHDLRQYEGMRRDIVETREATHEDPHWTGRMFGGMPAYLIDTAYPAQVIKNTIGQVVKIIDTPTGFLFFAMTAFWIMLLLMGVNPWVGVVPSLAYGLSTYFFLIIGAGHATKMWAMVYAPLMMGGAWMTLRSRSKRKMWLGGALTALFASLEIGANHPQITYYFLLAMAALWISEGIFHFKRRTLRKFGIKTAILLGAGILAVGSNFAPLYYTTRHTPYTIRGGSVSAQGADTQGGEGLDLEYATAWSYGRTESWTMLVPDLMGGDSGRGLPTDGRTARALRAHGLPSRAAAQLPSYWGSQPYTAGPTYLGATAIFLAILGLFLTTGRNRWWIVAVSLLALLLAWGSHLMWFTELAFEILPGYNKFRTVSMALAVLQWTVPLLAALALVPICRGKIRKSQLLTSLACAAGITGGICLLFALFGGSIFSFGRDETVLLMDSLVGGRVGEALADAIVTDRWHMARGDAWRSLSMILLAAGSIALYALKKVNRQWLVALLSVIVIVDMLPVDLRFQPHERFVAARHNTFRPTEADKQILRDKDPAYRVLNLTVSPFNDATTSYFHRSVGGYHGAKLANYQYVIDRYLSQEGPAREEMLDMLNTRYVIVSPDSVLYRPTARGAAWFPDGEGEIELVEYLPYHLTYEYTSDASGMVIFSEIYYPDGWKAYVDGVETPYSCAHHIFRAVELPAGTHTVEWRFKSPHWSAVEGVTLICSLLILIGLAASLILYIYERRKKIA